jgi:hypothetical protein
VPERMTAAQPDDELARLPSNEAGQVNGRDRVISTHRVQCQRTSRLCQRSRVPGLTSRAARCGPGSSRAKAASTARSAQSSLGLGCCRRSTASSWRSTSSSASFDAGERASNANHPVRRTNIR